MIRYKGNDPVWGSDGSNPDPKIIEEECGGIKKIKVLNLKALF